MISSIIWQRQTLSDDAETKRGGKGKGKKDEDGTIEEGSGERIEEKERPIGKEKGKSKGDKNGSKTGKQEDKEKVLDIKYEDIKKGEKEKTGNAGKSKGKENKMKNKSSESDDENLVEHFEIEMQDENMEDGTINKLEMEIKGDRNESKDEIEGNMSNEQEADEVTEKSYVVELPENFGELLRKAHENPEVWF